MKKFFSAFLLLAALVSVGKAHAQTATGWVINNDCGTIFAPREDNIVCLQLLDHPQSGRLKGVAYMWDGSAWVVWNSAGGSGSVHQVGGVAVTTNDPINFQDSASIDFTNPSAGNITAVPILQSGSGLTISSGLSLLRTCADGEIQKWTAGSSSWGCAADATGGSPTWNSIADPGGNQALSMAARTTTWTWGNATGASTNMFSLLDTTGNTGTGYLASLSTASGSAAKPLRLTAQGTANGVEMTTTGALQAIGTGSILTSFSNVSGTATNGQLPSTLSSKTLDNTNTITVLDTNLNIQDNGDTSKQGRFNVSAITPGTTRTYDLPNANTRLLSDNDFSGTQTGVLERTGVATYTVIKNNSTGSAPTANSDSSQGYAVGSMWLNTATSNWYRAVSVGVGTAVWQNLGATTEADTLATVMGRGNVATAESFATGLQIQNSGGTVKVSRFVDATHGPRDQCSPECDARTFIPTNKTYVIYDEEGAANMLVIDPDAASKNAMYQFGSAYKPSASFEVPLTERGATTIALAGIVSNQPKDYWATITDADTDALDFNFRVTKRMEGMTTATVTLEGVSDNAAPSGNIQLHCAMTSVRPGVDTYAAHSTTGEQAITLTPATQNRPVAATSPAITINGTIVEGARVWGSCEVSAAGTTSAQLTDFFLLAKATITVSVNSISD